MSTRTFILFLFILLLSKVAEAQDYTKGFSYLEKGEFDSAYAFFDEKIKQGHDDMTVRLCYGRAMGLKGEPKRAHQLFEELLTEYPGNYELELNLAESLMWMKDYEKARLLYATLIDTDSSSFAATLGYANALSSVKDYMDALYYVEKALTIQPSNANAGVSRKFILLGLAESVKLNNDYDYSKEILNNLYNELPGDIDIGIPLSYLNMDLKNFNEAENTLKQIIIKDYQSQAKKLQALSSLELRKLDYKSSLSFLETAIETFCLDSENCDVPEYFFIQKANTQIALKDYNKASEVISLLKQKGIGEKEITDLRVNLLLSQQKFKEIEIILDTVNNEEQSLEIRSKIAIQKRDLDAAGKYLDSLNEMAPNSVFYHYMSKELNKSIYHEINPIFSTLSDNGGNEVKEYGLNYTSSPIRNLKITAFWKMRVSQQDTSISASHKNAGIGLQYFLSPELYVDGHFGLSKASSESSSTSRFSYHSAMSWNKSKLLNLKLSFVRSYQDYNAGLIKSNLSEDRLSLQYHNSAIPGLGLYAEAAKSFLSDGNSSDFYYVSIFRNIRTLPLLQVGINGMYLSYKSKSDAYFAPEKYTTGELFVKYDNKFHPHKKIIYSVTGAIGMQKIEDNLRQNTNRLELQVGYKFQNQSYLTAYFKYNNSSSASAAGYSYTSLGATAHIRI